MANKSATNWFHFHRFHWDMNIIEYYLYKALRQIGISMTNLFIPIYLLADLKYELWQVLLFYFLIEIGFPIGVAFAAKIIEKTGLKKAMVIELPLMALYFWSINQLTGNVTNDLLFITPFLLLRAFFGATSNVSNDIFMAKHVLQKSSGTMIAWMRIIITGGTLAAPLVGGIISFFFGFDALFYAAVAIVLLSGIPLFLAPDTHFKLDYTPTSLFTFIKEKARPNYLAAEFGNVFTDTVMWVMWPIFLYFALSNTAEMGTLVTISATASIIVSYFIGKKLKFFDPKKLIRWGVRSASFLFFARPLILHPLFIGVVDSVYKVVDPVFRIPYDQAAYRLVMSHEHIIKRANIKQLVAEIYYASTITLLFIFTYLYQSFSKTFFIVIFLISAVVMLLMQRMAHVRFKQADKAAIAKQEGHDVAEKSLEIIEKNEF